MKSILALIAFVTFSTAFAQDTVFTCRDRVTNPQVKLVVSPSAANFAQIDLARDKTYVPGNNGKRYYRYLAAGIEILVPTLMAQNKTNQGVVLVYTSDEKIAFSCLK